MVDRPAQIAVVVPVRDEEQLLPRCLTALDAARRSIEMCQADPPLVRVVVVLDRCTDGSAQIAASWPRIEIVTIDAGLVGVARAAGMEYGLRAPAPAAVCIACTDADSVVPANGLVTQLRGAQGGPDVLLGTVRPDP